MGDVITVILLIAALGAAIVYAVKHKGKNGCHGCSGVCEHCDQKKTEENTEE